MAGEYDQSSYPRVADDTEGPKAGSLLENELQCPVCVQVLLDPMTLMCGHSFCQLCLARIWSSTQHTSKLLCPSCRNPMTQMPSINIQLRNIVESMYSEDAQRRRAAHTDQERQLLSGFTNKRRFVPQTRRVENVQLTKAMIVIGSVCFACLVLIGLMVLWVSWGADGKFMRKPVTSWDHDDVLAWVEGLGDWTIPKITGIFKVQALTGQQLLLVDNDTLVEFGVEPSFRRQTIVQAVSQLREDLYSQPMDLYQFKAAHRRTSLLLTLFYSNWPRLTLFYCYVFEYYSVYLPLGRAQFSNAQMDLSWLQTVVLLALIMLSPHVPVSVFTVLWFTTHPWICLSVFVHCGCAMVQQSQVLIKAHTMRIRHIKALTVYGLQEVFKFAVYVSLYIIVWPLIPHFICDVLFYVTLWTSCITYMLLPPLNYIFKQ